jgi:hypothetical protein
LETPNKHHWQ